jgi:pimeloyl-ACP methyl ester carboxylesterase
MERAMTETFRVDGQEVHRWPGDRPDAPVVLAVHGITANALAWSRVAELLGGAVTLLAPDLRGRAGSRDLPGPYGIARHADDVAAILDAAGAGPVGSPGGAVVVGHSMGAYVAALTAVRHPARVAEVVLVDGGLSFPLPAGLDAADVLAAIMGPALQRLDTTFPSRDAYREFWRAHPAFGFAWSSAVEAYVQHDLVGDPVGDPGGSGPFRSSCVPEAVRVDGAEMLVDPVATAAIHHLPVPGTLLYADRGLLAQVPGAYTAESLAGLEIPAVRVPDTNHYSILFTDDAASIVADHILRAAARIG